MRFCLFLACEHDNIDIKIITVMEMFPKWQKKKSGGVVVCSTERTF